MADRKLQLTILSTEVATGAIASRRRKEESMLDEADIRRRIDDLAEAVRAADVERIMSFYAADMVTFDIVPPLQKVGAAGKRRNWMDVFRTYQRPLGYELHGLTITVGGDVAFARSLNRITGALEGGTKIDQWVRWTVCLRKIAGTWLIAHDHISVPTDFATGKSLVCLEP
jgi:ketosteroid isomerase-like protein